MSTTTKLCDGALALGFCALLAVVYSSIWIFGGKDARRALADNYDEDEMI